MDDTTLPSGPDSPARDLILFVDDQAVARKYFALMFASEYEVLTANDADEAWNLIRTHEDRLAVVISDQRMGAHSGVDLLAAVRQQHPHIVRLLTTGYADLDEALDAVSRGEITAYIYKPWNIEELGLEIQRAVELHHLQRERDTLLDLQGSAVRHALYADRLRAYGTIAATCSGWIDRPLAAALAFWADCRRHFRPVGFGDGGTGWTDVDRQSREILACAATVGAWLSLHRGFGSVVTDGIAIAAEVAEELGQGRPREHVHGLDVPLDLRLFRAGLEAMARFVATMAGAAAPARILADAAADGWLEVRLAVDAVGATDQDAEALREAECLGLQAYLAVHHHGGAVAVRGWTAVGGTVVLRLPPRPPERRDDAVQQFHAALEGTGG